MIINFQITIGGQFLDIFHAISSISRTFLSNLEANIAPFGYKLESEIISEDEAKKIRRFCCDFRIEKDEKRSRIFRIECSLAPNANPVIGIVANDIARRPDRAFRERDMMMQGRSSFLNYYIQVNGRLRRNSRALNIRNPQTYYFSIIVNEEIVMVYGGNQRTESASCIYANYISLIKSYHLYKDINQFVWLSNGVYGVTDSAVTINMPISVRSREPYAKLGSQLKVRYSNQAEFEYGSAKIMILPDINDFVNAPNDEPYRVFFENIYGTENNVIRIINTINGITTKPALILIY